MRLTPIIGALACLGLASAAAAADFGGSLKDGPILAAHPNWSGLYIGGHVGWATGEWDGTLTYDEGNGPVPNIWDNHNQTLDDDGWIGGVQVGFNLQNASFVYGIEADASWADFGGSGSFTTMAGEPTWHVNQDLDAFGTVRARLGFLVTPRLMIYGTGGLAWAKTSASHTVTEQGIKVAAGSADETHVGWAAGAGGEIMVANNWTLRAEWLHVDLGKEDYHLTGSVFDPNTGNVSGPLTTDSFPADLTFDVFRLGVNYKFGN